MFKQILPLVVDGAKHRFMSLPAHPPETNPDYSEILVEGALDENWSDWLNGVSVTALENGQTLLCGEIPDQAALHGLLARIRDLNLKLISVKKKGHEA